MAYLWRTPGARTTSKPARFTDVSAGPQPHKQDKVSIPKSEPTNSSGYRVLKFVFGLLAVKPNRETLMSGYRKDAFRQMVERMGKKAWEEDNCENKTAVTDTARVLAL